ncbi:MAG: GNAT family N-acetyltransferase [Desulfobulbus sp.]|jgi:putative acetyltransferase
MPLHIRPEEERDTDKVKELLTAAYSRRPRSSYNQEILDDKVRRASPALTLALVAEQEERIVGYLALSRVELSDNTPGWYAIAPLAIHPDLRQQGIGTRLVTEALARLRAMEANGCVVIGPPSYYRRFGFDSTPELLVEGIASEYFLVQPFTDAGARSRGIVVYNPVFFDIAFLPERRPNHTNSNQPVS